MAAYFIAIKRKTLDADALETYKSLAPAAATPGLKRLARYGAHEDVESDPIEGVVLVEFPTMEEARAWYHGDAYQKAKQYRLKGGEYTCILFEGV